MAYFKIRVILRRLEPILLGAEGPSTQKGMQSPEIP